MGDAAMMNNWPMITILTAIPLVGGLVIIGLPARYRAAARVSALAVSLLAIAMTGLVLKQFDAASGELQLVERHSWISSLNVEYHTGIDGMSFMLLALTVLLVPMAIAASWKTAERAPLYFGLVLLLEAGLIGTFTALNFFHWFLYWELSLVPAFFLVRLWGGPLRVEAATQFFLYTMAGSVALLLAFLALYLCTGTFSFPELARMGGSGTLTQVISDNLGWRDLTTRNVTLVIFGLAFLGFAVKVPLFPLHTWLPITYSEAPTGVTMLLTGLMSKMGVYGFVRILLPIFPIQMHWMLKPLLGLAILSIVLSAAAAWAQRDIKRLLAYSSINHLGYCLLAIFAMATAAPLQTGLIEKVTAMNGVLLQMFNHGLTAAVLFWMAGLLQARAGGPQMIDELPYRGRGLDDFGGLRKTAPVFCGLMGIALFASLGLPGLNGFVSEYLMFKGVFGLNKWAAILAVPGLLFTAVFILRLIQDVFAGPVRGQSAGFRDLGPKEWLLIAPALMLMLLLGIYPQALIGLFNATATTLVQQIGF
jgi:NADH-quinone oxidoreductase subunit M